MAVFDSGAELRPVWARAVAVMYGSEGRELGFPSVALNPCPDISINFPNEPPSWIFGFGDKMTEWGRSGHMCRVKGPILPIDGLRSKSFNHRGAPESQDPAWSNFP